MEYDEPVDRVSFDFGLKRREFVQLLGAGLLISICEFSSWSLSSRIGAADAGGRGGGRPIAVAARLHIAKDGTITVLTGKVECGQGSRAELTQAAAEELRIPVQQISLVMADTDTVPNDGTTAGSRSTPTSVPAIRQAAATARDLLKELARREWDVPAAEIEVRDGKVIHVASRAKKLRRLGSARGFQRSFQNHRSSRRVSNAGERLEGAWLVDQSTGCPGVGDRVAPYPSDILRPGMLYGKVLRPPSYGAKLLEADLGGAKRWITS